MCHSENRYDDKQDKNRWGLRNLALENTYGHGYKETVGTSKLWAPLGKWMWR